MPAPQLVHGKTRPIRHDGRTLFAGLPDPFPATRYHSLAVESESLTAALEVSAWTDDGTIMGLRHRDLPLEGVQFHPESILTRDGTRLLRNWLGRVDAAGTAQSGGEGTAERPPDSPVPRPARRSGPA